MTGRINKCYKFYTVFSLKKIVIEVSFFINQSIYYNNLLHFLLILVLIKKVLHTRYYNGYEIGRSYFYLELYVQY